MLLMVSIVFWWGRVKLILKVWLVVFVLVLVWYMLLE